MKHKKQKYTYSSISLLVLFSIVFSSLLLISGCESEKSTKADRDEVRAVMEMRQKAIRTQDIALYRQAFTPDYDDAGINLEALVEVMQHNFDNHKSIEFTFRRSMVDMTMNSARMVGDISYQVSGSDKKVYDKERTIFRRVDGVWRISGGISAIPL